MTSNFRLVPPLDLGTEQIISLSTRGAKPNGVSPTTFARWLQRGAVDAGSTERVRPATILIGGRRLTSIEAMISFFAAQNATGTPASQFTPTQRQRMADAASRALAAAGL